MDGPTPGDEADWPDEDAWFAEARKLARRRIAVFLVGLATFILALQVNAVALGWPTWLPGVLEGVAVVIMLAVPFGLRRGLGCAGQLLVLLWLGSLTCGAAPWHSESGAAFARTLLLAGALALLMSIWWRRALSPEEIWELLDPYPTDPEEWDEPWDPEDVEECDPPPPGPSHGAVIDVEGHDGPPRSP